jgi:AraC-like DNA-binding protein
MPRKERRRIDWRVTVPDEQPVARLVTPPTQTSEFAEIASSVLTDPSPQTLDRLLRCSVDFARNVIHLERAAIFLLESASKAMVGTWGTSAAGETVDEHDIMYDFGDLDREIFARAEQGFAWTIYEDCPHITQVGNDETKVIGRGWVGCTAIIGSSGPLGILYNDSAITHDEVDESKQARAAVLCSLLARAIESSRTALSKISSDVTKSQHRLVREVTQALVRDPSLSCESLAKGLQMSSGQLARTFKHYAQISIVDHRNEIRLARFLGRVDTKAGNLLEAALEAGFGSYAQFHRVFRARFGQAPREYLLEHRASH